ncbi:hypothetical protein [Streptomyces sp. NPDC052701]|uniref:hypothetical protein n=1 Tax=Streptomyces sp. NPDC052701 TaxID=3155533 RepID=UPI0034307AC2
MNSAAHRRDVIEARARTARCAERRTGDASHGVTAGEAHLGRTGRAGGAPAAVGRPALAAARSAPPGGSPASSVPSVRHETGGAPPAVDGGSRTAVVSAAFRAARRPSAGHGVPPRAPGGRYGFRPARPGGGSAARR